MQTKIEKFGDSYGLLLPKELLDACGFGAEAIVTVEDRTLIVTPPHRQARQGWAEALRAIPREKLERDLADLHAFRETPHQGDTSEWHWPDSDADEKI